MGRLALLVVLCATAPPGSAQPAPTTPAAPPAPRRTVVVLYSLPPEIPGARELSVAINEGMEKGAPAGLDLYSEYTGLDRFSGATYEQSLLTLYNEKYASRHIDLLMVVGPTALQFVLKTKFLRGVPLVTCYVATRFVDLARAERPELTGALPPQNAPKVLDLMLAMYPNTRRVHVVLGASDYERDQAEQGRRIFKAFEGRLDLSYLNDLSLAQLQTRVASLPDEDLVLYGSLMRDAAGRDFSTNEPLTLISKASRRPVFGVVSEDLGDGIVGGLLLSMELSGRIAAGLANKVLAGERASAVPVVHDAGVAPMFDWRELKRWGIRERSLPPGSIVKFRQLGLWDTHWKELSAGIGFMVLESLLVAGLVLQLKRRRRIERELALAKTRYRTVADFTYDWEFWRRPDGSFEYVSPACERVTGHPPAVFKQDPKRFEELVLAQDRARWDEFQALALTGKAVTSLEYRIRRADGEVRWVEQANNPVQLDGQGLAGSRGSLRDVTARKQAELELQKAYKEIGALKDQLEAENTYYREKIQEVDGASELIGDSDPMKYLRFRISQVAPSATSVLIQGETGTGKELVAEAIHQLGPRKDKPLVKINCAALPPDLAESELFGHEKGAFTGAQAQRKGRFELADGATLFLDEVGELTPEVQAKLLRVLQDGEFQRVGGDKTLKGDVRVVAATNRDLSKEVANGRFREDLWYRLNVFPITVPALRHRKEDVPALAQAFVERFCERMSRPRLDLPRSVVQALQAYSWPGNVRELQNVIEQAVLVSDGTSLRLAEMLKSPAPSLASASEGAPDTLEEMERSHITRVLEATGWKVEGKQGAAAILGLKPSTLRSRMSKLEIQRKAL